MIISLLSNCVVSKKELNNQFIVNIVEFGAIPNDSQDNSDAIQMAIDFAIKSKKSSRVFCPPGVYILNKGLIISRIQENGEYGFVTLTIGGNVATYSGDQNIGKVVVFKMNRPTFGLALQSARNCVIENIVFEGCAKFSNEPKEILNLDIATIDKKYNIINNPFSPSCAIVIDPFHKNILTRDRYKDHESKYTNLSTGGSSMVLIKGCSFIQHYISIANNPSANVQNGDNIRAENCHVSTCHTFWSTGQTQSRGNSIENVYALFLNTFVSGTQIGSGNGTPPSISNVNLAGFCKQVFDIQTGFSGLNVYRSYFESIWSLGLSRGLSTSFDQCQFSFVAPNHDIFMPPFQLYTSNSTSFRDCNIQYFNNCNTPMPYLFRSLELLISGGSVEGGVVVADGITNAGGDDLHKVTLQNVFIKCKGKVAGKKSSEKPVSNIRNEIIMGGEAILSSDGDVLINQGSTYTIEFTENSALTIDRQLKTLSFLAIDTEKYKIGDNLFSDKSVTFPMNETFLTINTYLGFVSGIKENKVIVSGVPMGLMDGPYKIYKVSYPIIQNINSTPTKSQIGQYKKVKE
ncbi:MAG: hypothetical protein KDC90_02350 [Ignavibacteriae bacterium]|nr:hypothetical protein [Ignavibacteriota bacterium]